MQFSLPSQLRHEIHSMRKGYPDFIFSGTREALGDHLPVFVYHTIEPAAFERDLRFLEYNGYKSAGMGELIAHLNGERRADDAVVLTFDDARSSFWRFAYPLLERYRMKAVLFAIPGLTVEAERVRPNLLSAWSGSCGPDEIAALDPDDATLCTWPELKAMHDSGVVEIESHSLFHREVFVDSEIQDFLGPDSSFVPYLTSATPYLSAAEIGQRIVPDQYYGLPLFQAAPLHGALPAWEVPDELRRVARELWQELSASERSNGAWRNSLRARWREIQAARALRRQTPSEVERSITEDVTAARDLIKEKLGRDAVDHFCLPWAAGSDLSVQILKALGVKSCSWGVIPGKKHNCPGDDAFRICRVKADFLWRLPGVGQRSLARVYARKIGRRLRREPVY